VGATVAYKWAQMGLGGNMHAIFALISWKRRGFLAIDFHRYWNMSAPLWTCKLMSKHGVESCIITQDQEVKKCALWWHCFGAFMSPSLGRQSIVHGIVLCLKRNWNLLFAMQKNADKSSQPHMAAVTIKTIWKLKFILLPHPAYGPSHALHDYHIFRLLTDVLHGHQFENEEEVQGHGAYKALSVTKNMLCRWHQAKLMDQSNKCVEKMEDYIKKFQCLHMYL